MLWAKPPMKNPRSPVLGWTRTTGWAVRYFRETNRLRCSAAFSLFRAA
jgi:hypothetical protein